MTLIAVLILMLPLFSDAFRRTEVNLDYHNQDGGYYEYTVSSELDPLTNQRKNSHKFIMEPSEAVWQRRLTTQSAYVFEFYLVDQVGNESYKSEVSLAPDYKAPGQASNLTLEPVLEFISPQLLSTLTVNGSGQVLPKELLVNVSEDQNLALITVTSAKLELRTSNRNLTWQSNLNAYWLRLLDSDGNEQLVLNLGR